MEGEPIPKKPPAALEWIGILVIISGFFLAVGSIRFTGWFVPTNLDRVYFICGASLLAGGVPIVWHHILREKHLNAIEDHNGKHTNSPSLIIMAPLALFSGVLGGMFVQWIYTPIVHNDSTEWPDEGGLISMLFATVTLLLFGYVWRVIQR